ncbi:Ankyrin repeat-containing domain [Lasallia pustulata]|uniref:Ankyrin repeat-containing domain n=1 Tax=Lasallia pustulata TaxID=136370 RepID=A0A1W5CVQ2_9LECA|nr:Ankyrin repeat-containing domain [Lasallia pustulata]
MRLRASNNSRIERFYTVGWTPLMVACQIGNLEIFTMLLDAGANPEPKSPMFKTALGIAKENGRGDIAEYLEKKFLSEKAKLSVYFKDLFSLASVHRPSWLSVPQCLASPFPVRRRLSLRLPRSSPLQPRRCSCQLWSPGSLQCYSS